MDERETILELIAGLQHSVKGNSNSKNRVMVEADEFVQIHLVVIDHYVFNIVS
jgi:hypothetical protein